MPVNRTLPIIELIFLPAHAVASGTTPNDPCAVALVSGNKTSPAVMKLVSGFAAPPVGEVEISIEAIPNCGSGSQVDAVTKTDADGTYLQEITLTGGPGIVGAAVVTGAPGARNSAVCTVGLSPTERPEPPIPRTSSCTPTGAALVQSQRIIFTSEGANRGFAFFRIVSDAAFNSECFVSTVSGSGGTSSVSVCPAPFGERVIIPNVVLVRFPFNSSSDTYQLSTLVEASSMSRPWARAPMVGKMAD